MKKENKEEVIKKYMKNLELTREEAEELWSDDHNDSYRPPLEIEQNKRKEEEKRKKETKKEKSTTSKNTDISKIEILKAIQEVLIKNGYNDAEIEKEKAIHFLNENYTLTLTKHRIK